MVRFATAAVLIPLVILLVFAAPAWAMSVVLALVAVLCMAEFLALARAHGLEPEALFAYGAVAGVFLLPLALKQVRLLATFEYMALAGASIAVMALADFFFSAGKVLVLSLRRQELKIVLPSAGATLLGVGYIGGGLAALWMLWLAFGGLAVLWLLVVVWSGDIFAYYVGRAIGRHKLAPRISPGKSIEGAIASLLAAVGLALLFQKLLQSPAVLQWLATSPAGMIPVPAGLNNAPVWVMATGAALVNVFAQLGDLVESALKRGAGVKDSGKLLPGHGGLLDRVDALLTAAPVGLVFVVIAWIFYGGGRIYP